MADTSLQNIVKAKGLQSGTMGGGARASVFPPHFKSHVFIQVTCLAVLGAGHKAAAGRIIGQRENGVRVALPARRRPQRLHSRRVSQSAVCNFPVQDPLLLAEVIQHADGISNFRSRLCGWG